MSRSVSKKAFVDNENKVVDLIHLFMRVIYTFLAWFVLGKGISSSTFFVSMFLFVFPILLDYLQFYFSGWSRRWLLNAEVLICTIWFMVSLTGLTGVLTVQIEDSHYIISAASDFIGFQGDVISVKSLWWFLGIMPFLATMDFACRHLAHKKHS